MRWRRRTRRGRAITRTSRLTKPCSDIFPRSDLSFYTKEGPLPAGTKNVVNALATKNKTWKGYYEDLTTHEAVFRYFPEVGSELLQQRRTAAGGDEERRECAGDEEQDVEGLLRGPHDSRSRVQIFSRGRI